MAENPDEHISKLTTSIQDLRFIIRNFFQDVVDGEYTDKIKLSPRVRNLKTSAEKLTAEADELKGDNEILDASNWDLKRDLKILDSYRTKKEDFAHGIDKKGFAKRAGTWLEKLAEEDQEFYTMAHRLGL